MPHAARDDVHARDRRPDNPLGRRDVDEPGHHHGDDAGDVAHVGHQVDEEGNEHKRFVLYPDNFDTRGLYDEFDIASRLMLIDAPDALRREQMRALMDKLFPMLKKEVREEIEKELKKWPISIEDMMANPTTMRTASNNLRDPTHTLYKTQSGKGDATKQADGSNSDNKRPVANKRQGQVTKDTK